MKDMAIDFNPLRAIFIFGSQRALPNPSTSEWHWPKIVDIDPRGIQSTCHHSDRPSDEHEARPGAPEAERHRWHRLQAARPNWIPQPTCTSDRQSLCG